MRSGGVPAASSYEEVLNTDSEFYGGSNGGNAGRLDAEAERAHGRDHSLRVTLPPLGTLFFKPSAASR